MCDAGYVCVSGSNNSSPVDGVTGFICLVGHYCPAGSGQGTKCALPSSINVAYLQHCNISLVYISHMNCCYEDPVCY
jgi:hypothetical protein